MNAGVHVLTRRGHDIHRCQNKTPDRKCDQEMWVTSRTGNVGWDLRKVSELSFSVWGRRLTFGIRRDQTSSLWWVSRVVVVGCWWKSQRRKIVYHSPHVEKPFNSKVIKSFVPELRSRKVFRVSGFLCYLYMSYEHSIYISHIRIMGMLQLKYNQIRIK